MTLFDTNSPDAQIELSQEQRLQWLQLIRSENVGPATFRRLLNHFGSAQEALASLPALSRRGGSKKPIRIATRESVEAEVAHADRLGVKFIALGEATYPPLLRHIHSAPPIIAVLGNLDCLASRTIGIVGARNASVAGIKICQTFAQDLGEAGYCIASGLARGIDAAAHTAALETGTIAVLAGGLDKIYPAEHQDLFAKIIDNQGLILSEMPLGWEARATDFPRRNRIISGLSLGVLVVEAARKSGSLISARYALEQNRDVFAIPGSPIDPRAQGANDLIQQGAKLVTSAQDIIDGLELAPPVQPHLLEDEIPLAGTPFNQSDSPDDTTRTKLINALSPTPIAIDDIITATQMSAATVQILLLELELAGQIERSGNQLVALI